MHIMIKYNTTEYVLTTSKVANKKFYFHIFCNLLLKINHFANQFAID